MAQARSRRWLAYGTTAAIAVGLAVGIPYVSKRWIKPTGYADATASVGTLAELERAEREQRAAALERATPEKFAELTQHSSLWEWWDFALPGNPLRDQALAAMRELAGRQVQSETMLDDGFSLPLDEIEHLDLEATAELCAASRRFLRRHADSVRMLASGIAFVAVKPRIETYVPALAWLLERGCDSRPELTAYETAALGYPDSTERRQFVARLARLRAAFQDRGPLKRRPREEEEDAEPM